MRLDIHQSSWAGLFDLLTVCENFVFYSPLVSSAVVAEQQRAVAAAQASIDAKIRKQPSSSSSATLNSAGTTSSSASSNPLVESDAFLARPKDSRRFKVVGLHMVATFVPAGGAPAIGNGSESEDMVLIEKIIDLMTWFKFAELESSMDANAEQADRLVWTKQHKSKRKQERID